jgi:hypothetical protein
VRDLFHRRKVDSAGCSFEAVRPAKDIRQVDLPPACMIERGSDRLKMLPVLRLEGCQQLLANIRHDARVPMVTAYRR